MIATAAMWYAIAHTAKGTKIPPGLVLLSVFVDLWAWGLVAYTLA